jgi:von Willebrand factor type A domain
MYFLKLALPVLLSTGYAAAVHAEADRSIALVLDASGSMKAKLPDGKTRMDAAKLAVAEFVGKLSPEVRLALRAYGHQSPTAKKDCKDTSLLSPFAAVSANKTAIIDQARALQPLGYTPITYALTRAAEDVGSEEAASHTVVLVSDGKETCQADPCAAAKALADADAKLVVHTVGVGVDAVTRSQLQCIATVARGSYYDANSAAELSSVLSKAADAAPVKKKQIVVSTPKPGKLKMKVAGQFNHDVLNAAGEKVEELSGIHSEAQLPAGVYSVKFGNGLWSSIEVRAGETTEIKPGYLEVKPLGSDFVAVLEPETNEKVEELLWTKPRATLIPGRFEVKFGKVLWPDGVEVKPGETTVLKPGLLNVTSKVGIFTFVVKDASGQEVDDGNSPGKTKVVLPPGKYVLEVDREKWIKTLTDAQRKMDIELTAGEELDVTIQ